MRDPVAITREPQRFAFRITRRDADWIETQEHRRVRGDSMTMSECLPRVGERTAASGQSVVDAVTELDEERAVAVGSDARIAQVRKGTTFTLAPLSASRTARDIGCPRSVAMHAQR